MTNTSKRRQRLALILAFLIPVPATALTAPRPKPSDDLCVVNRSAYTGNVLNTLVFHDVQPLLPGRTIPLHGLYFAWDRIATPFQGSAVMTSDGTIRIGIVVHNSARNKYDGLNYPDGTFSGLTDASFAGTLNASFNGDLVPDDTVTFSSEACSTIAMP